MTTVWLQLGSVGSTLSQAGVCREWSPQINHTLGDYSLKTSLRTLRNNSHGAEHDIVWCSGRKTLDFWRGRAHFGSRRPCRSQPEQHGGRADAARPPAAAGQTASRASTYMLRISVSPIGSSSSAAWKGLWIVFPAWILTENITWCLSRLQRLLFKSINPETSCWIRKLVVLLFPLIFYPITLTISLRYSCYIVTAKHEVCPSRIYWKKLVFCLRLYLLKFMLA